MIEPEYLPEKARKSVYKYSIYVLYFSIRKILRIATVTKREIKISFQKREKKIYLRDSFSLNVPEIKQPASFHICLVAVPDKFCPKPEAKVRELWYICSRNPNVFNQKWQNRLSSQDNSYESVRYPPALANGYWLVLLTIFCCLSTFLPLLIYWGNSIYMLLPHGYS